MDLKNEILNALAAGKGDILPGAALTRQNVSRNAVWKAVKSLKKEGWPIENIPKKGYRLVEEADILNAGDVSRLLGEGFKAELLDSVDSTNNELRRRASAGASGGLLLLADSQMGGKGRMGRSFFSPPGGLYFSLLIKGVRGQGLGVRAGG